MRTAQQIEENKEKSYSLKAEKKNKRGDGRGMHRHPNSFKNLAPYPKGVSGNPGGLPGTDVAARIVRNVFELNEQAIYEGVAKEVMSGKPYAFDVASNRAYGKVKETIDMNVTGTIKLANVVEQRRSKRAGGSTDETSSSD